MKCVLPTPDGGVTVSTAPMPQVGGDEVLIKVVASSLNRADILQKKGKYPPPKGSSQILGLEASGIVESAPEASGFAKGDRVMALLTGGGQAEYVTAHKGCVLKVPNTLSFEEAAAISEAFITAYQVLFCLGRLNNKECVLVHAGASGVGTAAIQIAKLREAVVLATVGSDEKADICMSIGADKVINYKKENFEEVIQSEKDIPRPDIIVDPVAGEYIQMDLNCSNKMGRIIILSALGGFKLRDLNIIPVLTKNLTIMGTTLRDKSVHYKEKLIKGFERDIMPHIAKGNIRPVIDSVYPLEQIAEAHRRMEQNKNAGKIVVLISKEA